MVVRSYQVSHVHGHLINLGGIVLLNIAQDLDVVILHKVDGHTLQRACHGLSRFGYSAKPELWRRWRFTLMLGHKLRYASWHSPQC